MKLAPKSEYEPPNKALRLTAVPAALHSGRCAWAFEQALRTARFKFLEENRWK